MDDNSWVPRGIDPDALRHAAEEAARRGLSLDDYLTEILIAGACSGAFDAPDAQPTAAAVQPDPPPAAQDPFPVERRLDLLKRRVGYSITRLDHGVGAIGGAVDELASRVDGVESLASDTAETVQRALFDIRDAVSGLRARFDETESKQQADALGNAIEHADFEQRLTEVEIAAHAAGASAAALAQAHEALKHAVADDFSDFAAETALRVHASLEDVRAAADAAAAQADAAVAHLVRELGAVRDAVERDMTDSATETRERMHAAFSDMSDRVDALTQRHAANDAAVAFRIEALGERLSESERGVQDGILALSSALRRTDAALSEEAARVELDFRSALATVHHDIAALREDRDDDAARMDLAGAALSSVATDLANLNDAMERRFEESAARSKRDVASALSEWDARQELVASALREADAAISRQTSRLALENREEFGLVRRELDALRDEQRAGAGRLDGVAQTLDDVAGAVAARHGALEQRLDHDAAQAREEFAHWQADWDARFDALAARFSLADRQASQTRTELGAGIARLEAATAAAQSELSARVDALAAHSVNAKHEAIQIRNDLGAAIERVAASAGAGQSEAGARIDALAARSANAARDAAQMRDVLSADAARIEACTLAALEKLHGDITAAKASATVLAEEARVRVDGELSQLKDGQARALSRVAGAESATAEMKAALTGRLNRLEAKAETFAEIEVRLAHLEDAATRGGADKAELEEVRLQVGAELDALKESQAELLSRVAGADDALGELRTALGSRLVRLEADRDAQAALDERLARLEYAAARAETDQAIAVIREQVAALAAARQHPQDLSESSAQRLDTLSERLDAQQAHAHDAAAQVEGIAIVLERHIAQSAEGAVHAEQRLARLVAATESLASAHDIDVMQQRLDVFEERQAAALDGLRAQICQFVSEHEQRLAMVEAGVGQPSELDGIGHRPQRLEQRDLHEEFEALRQNIEDRILGLEGRSVRALEQVGETIVMLQRRLLEADVEHQAKSG